jgi:hypothetical protein
MAWVAVKYRGETTMRSMTAVTTSAAITTTALAAIALAACSSSPPSPSNPTSQACSGSTAASGTASVGNTLTLTASDDQGNEDIAVTVVKVVPSASSSEAGFSPDSGDQWVAVEFCIKNLASAPYVDSPNESVAAVDAAGQSVPAQDDAPTTVGPAFADALALTKGESSTGVITFQVPTGDKIITVQFTPEDGTGTDVGKWTVG